MYNRTYNKNVLQEEKLAKVKKPFPWMRMLLITIVVVIVVSTIVLIKTPKLQVKSVDVVGTHVADPSDVSSFVMGNLNGKYLKFLPKTSILLVHTSTLANKIKIAFPRFKDVSVNRSAFDRLEISVTEYEGVYLWCLDQTDNPETSCSFMDERGIVFSKAPYFSGNAYIKIFGGNSETQSYPFSPLSVEYFQDINLLTSRLKAINIEPTEFHFVTEHELRVTFNHFGDESFILFDPTNDIDESLGALFTGMRTEPLNSEYGDRSKVLEYLDTRFDNKLVYKFR